MHKLKLFITIATFMLSMFVAQSQTPGGVTNPNYTWQVWLTPDSYDHTSGIWTNQITSTGSVGNFYAPALRPAKIDNGYNFHPSVEFTKSSSTDASKRLVTNGKISIVPGQNVTCFFVYKRANTTQYDILFSFDDANRTGDLAFYENNNSNLRLYWATTNRNPVLTAYEGMIAIDNSNTASNTVVSYLDGVQKTSYNLGSNNAVNIATFNSPWVISAYGNTNSGYSFEGIIQEIIILKATGANNHIAASDLQKIHSYLALKYGIGMESQNYLASDGVVTWNTSTNSGYNYNIFGIGRDDATRLYQKESVSRSNNQTTLFLGTTLETLNDKNTSTLGDKQYLVLGSNGVTSIKAAAIANGVAYANGNIDASQGLNFQSGVIYKAQLTNLPAIQVNVKVKADYLYAFVSKDADFTPTKTKIYPVNLKTKTASIEVDTEYKYIRFAGYSPGPGGINTNLVLWLHADDDESLEIQTLPLTDARLNAYPYSVSNNEAPAVLSWADPMRGQTYSWSAGSNAAAHRIPVYEPDNLMMNFHPSVRFWGSGTNYGSYLSNPKGILSTSHPANDQHTAYFVTSNNFNTNDWIYAMMFGNVDVGQYNGPGYGMQKSNNNLVGRFRTDGNDVTGAANLFSIGATSINGYYQDKTTIKFRFNGKDDNGTSAMSWTGFDMSAPSMLGPGYRYNRTLIGVMSEVIIFEKALSIDERRQLESYLAIKYGTTLRPSNTATNRFDYVLSNGKAFWPGNVVTSDPVYGKYASFYNNVTAVIRDDAARLHNRQSHSTNAGSILHMGVAGKKLGSHFDVGDLLYDQEVIAWGSNGGEGITNVALEACAGFDAIFNRKWMVHKQTEGDRPITMLVGAENNLENVLGSSVSADIKAMYHALDGGHNDLKLIVVDSPEKLMPGDPAYGDFKAVVPMYYIDGEYQCAYTFTDEISYITFGYQPSHHGCTGDISFAGTKTYNWNTQWTRQNYNLNGQGGAKIISKPEVDLDDNITVTTKVVYDNVVRANSGYPRFVSSPRNALDIQRRYGTVGVSKIVTTIEFSSPIIPSFYISGIDSRSRQYDQVAISASCSEGPVTPVLMYAGAANNATYVIQGNNALGNKNRSASNTSVNGRLDVTFHSGVTTLVIEYVLQGRVTSSVQNIFISPLTLRSVSPPAAVNEDGISFTKRAQYNEITTCEPMEYTYRIVNTNTDGARYMHFTDVLPDKMTWEAGSVGFEGSALENPKIAFNNYGGSNTLEIDSLLIPCASEVIFRAIANMDKDAPSDTYANRATIDYTYSVNKIAYSHSQDSFDEDTGDPLTAFDAVLSERKDTLHLDATVNPEKYDANDEISVILKVTNPNPDEITNVYLDLAWDANFSYVAGSWDNATGSRVTTFNDVTSMTIGNMLDGSSGFTLPSGETVFTFKLRAPNPANLAYELGTNGQATNKKSTLNISCEFSLGNDDPCVSQSMDELSGVISIPYVETKSQIIINKHVTTKIVK